MNSTTSDTLRERIIDLAASGKEPRINDLKTRPLFMLGTNSLLGRIFAPQIATHTTGIVAVVSPGEFQDQSLNGAAKWTEEEFLAQAAQHKDAVALDFSQSITDRAWVASICNEAGVIRADCLVAQAQLGLVSVYEYVRDYRAKTLQRMDDFLDVANRLSDNQSRATLYSNLLFRLSYDRSYLAPYASPSSEEYFSNAQFPSSFKLGSQEHFCDCGAYQGPIIKKFLEATDNRYASITAFEPDSENFKVLQQLSEQDLVNLRLVNKAVSSRRQTLRFMETGTVSSYVSAEGQSTVQTTRLDDELSQLSFLKMDVEGFESKTLQGGAGIIASCRPRIASCVYHYAYDLLDVIGQLEKTVENYHLRLRQHDSSYYYDLVLYASPVSGVEPTANLL